MNSVGREKLKEEGVKEWREKLLTGNGNTRRE